MLPDRARTRPLGGLELAAGQIATARPTGAYGRGDGVFASGAAGGHDSRVCQRRSPGWAVRRPSSWRGIVWGTHGIDFVEAQAVWSVQIGIELPARPTTEPRFLIVGQIKQASYASYRR